MNRHKKQMIKTIISGTIALLVLMVAYGQNRDKGASKMSQTVVKAEKFVPPAGKTLLLVGQDVNSIEGYLKDVAPSPAGFMIYTNTSFPIGLDIGIDLGAGTCHAGHFTKDKTYANTVLQLGLYMVNDLQAINNGQRDTQIKKIGNWIESSQRPVYLRIGYEFDGPWNHYEPEAYIKAYRRIAGTFRKMGVDNISYIWSSAAVKPYKGHPISAWYPGDDYVDWVGISVFRQFDGTLGKEADIKRLCDFARTKKLPIAIVESTPYGSKGKIPDGKWNSWFKKAFQLIEDNDIRMFCYINADWDKQRMWKGQGWGDCRIQSNPKIKEKWLKETSKERYLKSSPNLFKTIGYSKD